MSDNNTIEAILRQIDNEESPDQLTHLITLIQQEARHSANGVSLSLLADDRSGYKYWIVKFRQCMEAQQCLKARIMHLRNKTALELQWLLDAWEADPTDD